MKTIIVSDDCMKLIRAGTTPGHEFNQTGTRRPDGNWDVPIGEDLLERIRGYMLAGETEGDCVLRILSTQGGKVN